MGTSTLDILARYGVELVEDEGILEHYGVPGMKWGKRRRANRERKTDNAQRAAARSKVKDMSDDDLKTAINRLKLEKEYKSLNAHQVSEGQKIVTDILKDVGKQYAKSYVTKSIDSLATPKTLDQIKAQALKTTQKPTPAAQKTILKFNKTFNGKI